MGDDGIELQLCPAALINLESGDTLSVKVQERITRRGQELSLMYPATGAMPPSCKPGVKLVGLLAKDEAAFDELCLSANLTKTIRAHLARHAKPLYLAQDIVAAIIDVRQPVTLTARALLRDTDISMTWADQRRPLRFA